MPENTARMLSRIKKYTQKQAQLKAESDAKYKAEYDKALSACTRPELLNEIKDLIRVANAASDAGIKFDTYMTDRIHHRLGFIRRDQRLDKPIMHVGYLMGGAAGEYDFYIDKNGPKSVYNGNNTNKSGDMPILRHMTSFLSQWPDFRDRFYEFLDKICPKDDE